MSKTEAIRDIAMGLIICSFFAFFFHSCYMDSQRVREYKLNLKKIEYNQFHVEGE